MFSRYHLVPLSFWVMTLKIINQKKKKKIKRKAPRSKWENFMRCYQIIQKFHFLFLYFKNKEDISFIPLYILSFKIVIVDDWDECIFLCLWLMDKHIRWKRKSDRPSHKGSFTVLCIFYDSPHSLAVPSGRGWKSWNGSYLWDGGWVWCF